MKRRGRAGFGVAGIAGGDGMCERAVGDGRVSGSRGADPGRAEAVFWV